MRVSCRFALTGQWEQRVAPRWSANGSITDSYLRHQPTPRPLTPLCVGLESIYVFNTPVNCSRLFPSLCMTGTHAL
jgi:hypothetical protein